MATWNRAKRVLLRSHAADERQIFSSRKRRLESFKIASVVNDADVFATLLQRPRGLRAADRGNRRIRMSL
jgi:hypothetical protein